MKQILCLCLLVCGLAITQEADAQQTALDTAFEPLIRPSKTATQETERQQRTLQKSVAPTHGLSHTRSGSIWKFTILAGVTEETADYYGGFEQVEDLIREQMETVNSRFNEPGVFEGTLEFVVESIYVFDTDPFEEALKPHPEHDFRVIYDGFPERGGGWFGSPWFSIYHAWSVSDFGGTFGSFATDGLTHEFGHARGAIDLYALHVDADKNPVNGEEFRSVESIMTYPYGVRVWDEHSVHLINRNADQPHPPITYITEAFPPSIGVVVTDEHGTGIPGAEVTLYPVEWYSFTLSGTPILSEQTNQEGELAFATNPFGPGTPGARRGIRYPNFLVEATFAGITQYAWLPLYEVQNSYFQRPEEPFWLTIEIPDGLDTTPPVCELVGRIQNRQIRIRVQDFESGLQDITVLRDDNAAVMQNPFTAGTNRPVLVRARKVDPDKPSVVLLRVTDMAGNITECDPVLTTLLAEVPESYRLEQNYPNPFNPSTEIRFHMPEEVHARLVVYDLTGREVARLIDEVLAPGSYSATWEPEGLPSGVYLYRIETGAFTETRRMMLVK